MRTKLLFAFMIFSIPVFGQQNPIQIDANGLTQTLTAGGVVTRGQIVKINSAGQVVPVATTDTSGAIGVAATSQTSAGNGVSVSIQGTPLVQIDASGCAAGNIVSISTTTAGSGHCSSTAGGAQVGIALSISSPGSNFWNVTLSLGGGGSGVPGQFSVKTYGAVGDAKKTFKATTANGSSTITDAVTSPWLAGDVGKKIFCVGGGDNNPLSVTIATISAFTSTSSISIAPATGNGNVQAGSTQCVWYTQKDTNAFVLATTAAIASTTSNTVNSITGYQGAVYCPPGGYVIDGPVVTQINAGLVLGVGFYGAGTWSCTLYTSPDIASSNSAWIMKWSGVEGFTVSGFTVDCSNENLAVTGPGIFLGNALYWGFFNVYIKGCNTSGDTLGFIDISNSKDGVVDQLFIDGTNGAGTGNEPMMAIRNASSLMQIRNYQTSNPGPWGSLTIDHSCSAPANGSKRAVGTGSCLLENVEFDEGSNQGALNIIGSSVDVVGAAIFSGTQGSITVDATSSLYLTDGNIVPFGAICAGNNIPAIAITGAGTVFATQSTLASCGTTGAVTGTSSAIFVDVGGNTFMNCTAGTCTNITPATFATQGFTGGIVPKATVTHTPNTCYAVTGNLLATAQNLCIILLDQNYQLLTMSAQSGGTTPANSVCATPPVITLSDGTRSATMTMTAGKTQWFSNVDAVTNINQVFASGATLTVSIGANTCATPPANVSVNYDIQSVLNP